MENIKSKTIFLPIACPDINSIVEGTNLKADKVALLLHQMVISGIGQLGYDSKNKKHSMSHIYKDGYVALDTKILRSLLTSEYKKYISFLKEKGIIQTRSSSSSLAAYTPGSFCIHYKFNQELLYKNGTRRHFRKETITDYCTIKAIIRTAENYNIDNPYTARSINPEPIHKKLFAMEKQIKFDLDSVEYWLDSLNIKDNPNIDFDTISDEVDKLHAINEGYFYQKIDVFGNRLYSPYKTVKRELRQFMHFDGIKEDLGSFDIKNSQLYFLSLLFNPKIVNEFLPEFAPINDIAAKYITTKDVQAFINYATNGSIYTRWQNYRELKNRDLAKQELIVILFAKVTSKANGLVEFNDLLPNVKAFIDEVKLLTEIELPFITKTYLDRRGDYQSGRYHCNLSCATQRLESRIFIKRFGQKLLDAKVQPFFTLHDSIYYPNSYSKKVGEVFEQCFYELDVPKPKIKIETPFF